MVKYRLGTVRETQNGYNFRCPVCGDSKSKKQKLSAYMYKVSDTQSLLMKCHRRECCMSFWNFLEFIDPELHDQYKRDIILECKPNRVRSFDEDEFKVETPQTFIQEEDQSSLTPLSQMPIDSMVVQYVKGRKIPQDKFSRLYYTDNFIDIVNSIWSEKMKPRRFDKRLVILIRNLEGKLCGLQGRSIGEVDKAFRFLTFRAEGQTNAAFGMEQYDTSKHGFIFEGGIDSLFLNNSLAVCSSNLVSVGIKNATYCFDNEPRNKGIVKKIGEAITKGYEVCLMPEKYYGMDINDIVLEYGYSATDMENLIMNYSFKGLQAKMQFDKWKKV